MGIKHELKRSINQVLNQNRNGSFATRADRRFILMQFAGDIVKLGFGLRNVHGLKEKHIRAVTDYWLKQQLSNATIKNRLSAIRRLTEYINKTKIVPSNQTLKIGARCYVPVKNKAIYNPDFSQITNKSILVSLHLQRLFGLRREESLKIKPFLADKGDYLMLLPSWCKGGRGRHVPITTEEQRHWLDAAKALVKNPEHSLIPADKNYIQHRRLYDKHTYRTGLRNLHGLRHAYAQIRYKELTGWEAPINGGPKAHELTEEQKSKDRFARLILTEELGHSRIQIAVNYCGK